MILPDDPNSSLSCILNYLNDDSDPIWSSPLCFTRSDYLVCVLQCILDRQYQIKQEHSFEELETLTLQDIKNIFELRKAYKPNSIPDIILSMLQMHLTLIPLEHLCNEKNLVSALTWIGYGLGDNFDEPNHGGQLQTFFTARGYIYAQKACTHNIQATNWFGHFYYVWRALGCDYDVGISQLDHALKACNKQIDHGKFRDWAINISCIACWLAHYNEDEAKGLIPQMESIITSRQIPTQSLITLLEALSSYAGTFSSKCPSFWAKKAIEEHHEELNPFQTFFFLATAISPYNPDLDEHFEDYFTKALDSLKSTVNAFNSAAKSNIYKEHRTAMISEPVSVILGNLIQINKPKQAIEIISTWYSESELLSNNMALIIGNHQNHILACNSKNTFISTPSEALENHKDAISTMNEFLGLSCSILGNKSTPLNLPQEGRFGVPNEDKSDDYYKAIVTYYKFDELAAFFRKENPNRIIVIPAEHHPFQFALKKSQNICLPINTSLNCPEFDRTVNRICIVRAANSITEELEESCIKLIFNKKMGNVEITTLSTDNSSKEDFISKISENKYDLIWIMSHGIYDHWNPESAAIEMLGERITLDELHHLTPSADQNGRRLLFLNICDGATSKNTGSFPRIGFAPHLSSSKQCVISHLWPTNPWASLCIGTWLAIQLSSGKGFFESYESTLENMQLGTEELITQIRQLDIDSQEIIDRLGRCNIDIASMAHSGSIAFYE